MKKVLLALLAATLVLGLSAAVGYTGYRFGYAQGVRTAASGETMFPRLRLFDNFERSRMPMNNFSDRFERNFNRDFGPGGFPMRGFGFFPPLRFLAQIVILGLILWFVHWLVTRSGWHLTRTEQTVETQAKPIETETKEQDPSI